MKKSILILGIASLASCQNNIQNNTLATVDSVHIETYFCTFDSGKITRILIKNEKITNSSGLYWTNDVLPRFVERPVPVIDSIISVK